MVLFPCEIQNCEICRKQITYDRMKAEIANMFLVLVIVWFLVQLTINLISGN